MTRALPITLGILAAITVATAWVPIPTGASKKHALDELPKMLGRTAAPADIAGIAVVTYDETAKMPKRIEIRRSGMAWTITSKSNYPADGLTGRIGRLTSSFLDLRPGRLVTGDPKQHSRLGVLDPLKVTPENSEGYGKSLKLTDATGAEVLSLIVGKHDELASNRMYVREAGSDKVYAAEIKALGDLNADFDGFAEADPFKLDKNAVNSIVVSDYQVDIAAQAEGRNPISVRAVTPFARAATAGEWVSSGSGTAAAKAVSKSALEGVLNEITALRVSDVRPFPSEAVDVRAIVAMLTSSGLFVSNPGAPVGVAATIGGHAVSIFGTEGSVALTTRDGLVYSFIFGSAASSEKTSDPAGRNLAVFVRYDEASDDDAKAAKAAAASASGSATAPAVKPAPGIERAAKQQQRFQQFFYVISDASFKKLRPPTSTLFDPLNGKTRQQWLDEQKAQPGITSTPSGLLYQKLAEGDPAGRMPTDSDTVRVAYRGTLLDGTEFDANADMTFGVTGVIKGWTEALKLMRPGDKLKLWVPPELGYGASGSPPKIGPDQILIFEVELKGIVEPSKSGPVNPPAGSATVP